MIVAALPARRRQPVSRAPIGRVRLFDFFEKQSCHGAANFAPPENPHAQNGERAASAPSHKPLVFLAYLVGAAGFEPTTPSPPDWCANRAAPRPDRTLI
jgi:hypothetical protein